MSISYRGVLIGYCGPEAMRDKSSGVLVAVPLKAVRKKKKNPLVTMETTLSLTVIVTLTQKKGQG